MNIENMIQGNPQALVKSVNGIMVADSLQVADSFGKQHSHVLRAIESLITSLSTEEAAVNDEEWMYKRLREIANPILDWPVITLYQILMQISKEKNGNTTGLPATALVFW